MGGLFRREGKKIDVKSVRSPFRPSGGEQFSAESQTSTDNIHYEGRQRNPYEDEAGGKENFLDPRKGPALYISVEAYHEIRAEANGATMKARAGRKIKRAAWVGGKLAGHIAFGVVLAPGTVSRGFKALRGDDYWQNVPYRGMKKNHEEEKRPMTEAMIRDVLKRYVDEGLTKIIKGRQAINYDHVMKNNMPPQVVSRLIEILYYTAEPLRITLPHRRLKDGKEIWRGALQSGLSKEKVMTLEFDPRKQRLTLLDGVIGGKQIILAEVSYEEWNELTFEDMYQRITQELVKELQRIQEHDPNYDVGIPREAGIKQAMDLLLYFGTNDKDELFQEKLAVMHAKDQIVDQAFSGTPFVFLFALQFMFNLTPEQVASLTEQLNSKKEAITAPNVQKLQRMREILATLDTNNSGGVISNQLAQAQGVYNELIGKFPFLKTMKDMPIPATYMVDKFPVEFAKVLELFSELLKESFNTDRIALGVTRDSLRAMGEAIKAAGQTTVDFYNAVGAELSSASMRNTINNAAVDARLIAETRVASLATSFEPGLPINKDEEFQRAFQRIQDGPPSLPDFDEDPEGGKTTLPLPDLDKDYTPKHKLDLD